jgi:PAS domain S-box-containing protein
MNSSQIAIESVFDELSKLIEYTSASIQIIHGDYRTLIGYRGVSAKADSSSKLHRDISDDPLISKITHNKKPLVISDVEKSELWERLNETLHVKSWMGVPLIEEGNVIGLLTIDHSTAGYYTKAHEKKAFEFANQVTPSILKNDLYLVQKERIRSLSEVHKIVTELHKISDELLSIDNTKSILDKIAQVSKDVLNADLIELYEYRENLDEYILPHIIKGDREVSAIPKEKIYKDDAVFNLITRTSPIYIKDSQSESVLSNPYTVSREDQPEKRYIIREKIKSTAVIPLRTGNESMGLMFANYRTPQEFPKEQQEIIALLANQAAIAIKNARGYSYVNERRKALVNVAKEITAKINLSEDDVIKLIYEQASKNLKMENFSIALYDSASDVVRFVLVSSNGNLLTIEDQPRLAPRRAGNGKTEKVIHDKRPLLISSWDELKGYDFTPKPDHDKYKNGYSWLGVPIFLGDTVMGVIANYDYKSNWLYSKEDIEILQALADLTAIALENSRNNLLRTLIEIVPDHIYVKDVQSRFMIANAAVVKTMGVSSEEELKGKTDHDFHPPELAEKFYEDEQRIVKSGEPMIAKEERSQIRATHEWRWLSSTKVPLKDSGDNIVGIVGINRDITLFKHLNDLVVSINNTLDLGELLETIVKGVVELVSVKTAGVIHLFDVAGQRITKSYSFPENFPHAPRFSEKKGQTWKIFNTHNIDEITDVSQSEEVSEKMRTSHIKSIIGVPLKLSDKVIGVLFLKVLDKQHKFTEDEKTLLKMLCEHATLVIERARRYEHLDLLREVSGKISATLDLGEVMPLILEGAIRLTGAEFGDIHLIDRKTKLISRSFDFPEGFDHPFPRLSENRGLTWEIFNSCKPIIIPDTKKDDLVNKKLIERGIRSLIGVPLKLRESVIGVLYLHYTQPRQYTEQETSFLFTLCDQAAISIENASLVESIEERSEKLIELNVQLEEHTEKLEERTENLNSLNVQLEQLNVRKQVLINLAQKLTSSIQLKENEIFHLIHRNASKLMDVENMYIALYDSETDIVRFGLVYKGGIKINTEEGKEEKGYKPRPGGKGKTEAIIRTKKPIFHPTKAEAEAWYDKPGNFAYDRNISPSWVGVPMITGDKVLGVIATYHPEREDVYSESDLEILQAMANIAAIALDNAKAYQQLKQAQNEIADKERELVMSGLAMDFIHKMNNIAGTIPPWVSLIKRRLNDGTDPKISQYLDNIVRDTSIILKEANELKNPSTKPEPTDMEEVTGSIIAQMEIMTPPKITFCSKYEADLFTVYGIKDYLSVAMHSVIMNSVKAISGQGEVTIHLKNLIKGTDKFVEINISDTGCGILQDKIDSIFEYGTSLWQDKKGTGYGLWRARSIIQNMNGSINVTHSEIGKGTTFTIMLPAMEGNTNEDQ